MILIVIKINDLNQVDLNRPTLLGAPNQSVPGPPNQSVMGGPQTRVCLGAPEGVNPPLRSIDPATFMPPLAKIPGSAPVLKNVCPGTTLYFQTDMLS